MGGQACVLYGAAEFSRDIDLAIDPDSQNLQALSRAIEALRADVIAVPPFAEKHLARGLAVHFRCHREDVDGLRIDVMTRMRGVDEFSELWGRRTTLDVGEGEDIDVLSLPDLVAAKKTQRDKDWPMIARLIEASYFSHRDEPNAARVSFWLAESRTPVLLREVVDRFPDEAQAAAGDREVVAIAIRAADDAEIARALRVEEEAERAADRAYWEPLMAELRQLRRAARHNPPE